ncbi:MAG TPA: ABC transporter permease [Anaerovoracaceae bacterium]|nr:ABC transporter permease [Anaerovoracaceae bacterium]
MNRFLIYWKKYGMFALLAILIATFSLIDPENFFTSVTFYNILKQASVIGVLSCGMTLILITGQIDISIGARVAFISIVCGKMLLAGVSVWLVIISGLLIGALTGVLNSILAEVLHTFVFVVSMATMYVWSGICYLSNGASTLYGFPSEFRNISQFLIFGKIPSIIVIFAVCAVISGFILSKTYFGRYIYAIGGNREAAYLAGIDVVKYSILTHALAGVFIGLGAIILMSRTMTATANTGGTFAFDSITACVLGGVLLLGGHGKIYQAILGVLVINVLFNGLTIIGVNDYWQMVVKGIILVVAIGIEVLQRYAKVDLSADSRQVKENADTEGKAAA